jgi:hypothetical protein
MAPAKADTSPDWVVVDKHHVRLRAERAGSGSGRVYTVTIKAPMACGNQSTADGYPSGLPRKWPDRAGRGGHAAGRGTAGRVRPESPGSAQSCFQDVERAPVRRLPEPAAVEMKPVHTRFGQQVRALANGIQEAGTSGPLRGDGPRTLAPGPFYFLRMRVTSLADPEADVHEDEEASSWCGEPRRSGGPRWAGPVSVVPPAMCGGGGGTGFGGRPYDAGTDDWLSATGVEPRTDGLEKAWVARATRAPQAR